MNATFLIDFGMTPSAAECLLNPRPDESYPIKHYKFGKTPTHLLYGDTDEVIAWGLGCKDNPQVTKHFKIYFGMRKFSTVSQNQSDSTRPGSMRELEKWISDYLHKFCSSVLDEVLKAENMTKGQLTTQWYLTTPGSWSEPIRLDFKMLAARVLNNLLPGSEVFTDITESQASCEFLVDNLRLPSGIWAITCDIGGATCDTALALIQTDGGIRIPRVFPIAGDGSYQCSVGIIDKTFRDEVAPYLRGYHGYRAFLAELVNHNDWQRVRHAFDDSGDVILNVGRDLGKWRNKRSKLSIEGFNIKISSELMREIFEPYLKSLWFEIDESLRMLENKTPRNTRPEVIALCGGGGTMAYPLKQLKLRYTGEGIKIKALASPEESCLATVIGHRLYHVRRETENYLGEILIGVSSISSTNQSPHAITWKDALSRITTFDFSSSNQNATHYFIVYRKCSTRPPPASFETLRMNPERRNGVIIWTVTVALGEHGVWREKYCVDVICVGRQEFNFKPYAGGDPSINLVSNTSRVED